MWVFWLGEWIFLAAMAFFPVRSGTLRLSILMALLGVWGGAFLLIQRKTWRVALLALTLGLGICLSLPGRPANPERLRDAYVGALRRYVGTTYVWGGEPTGASTAPD